MFVAGLPGTGKSTLARELAERANFTVIRSDMVRKELAGLSPEVSARGAADTGLYTPQSGPSEPSSECLRRAETILSEGGRVIVDANFPGDRLRLRFLDMATRLAVPALFLWCRASPEVAKQRIEARRNDASDADTSTYERVAARWDDFGAKTQRKQCAN